MHKIALLAGQEGLEPPTPGFGVRCSTIRATGLARLFCFLMQGMDPAEAAVLLKFQLMRRVLLIFCGGVIPLLANGAP